jgi:hypothetical protein
MMDTTEQHTRRLWIDPDAMSELVSGLVETGHERAMEDGKEAAKWAELSDELLAVVDDDKIVREEIEAFAESPAGAPTVAPEIFERLNQRLALIRDVAARSGAMAADRVGRESSTTGAVAVEGASCFASPEAEECVAGDSEVKPRSDESTDGIEGATREQEQQGSAAVRALPGLPEGILYAEAGKSQQNPAAHDDENFARFRDRVASLCKDVSGGPRKQVAAAAEDDASLRVRADSGSIEFSSHASPQEKFATLAQWLEGEIGEKRFVLVDEHGLPIDLWGIERQRFDEGGDLSVLLQRARQAIGATEIGIHLAIDDAEGESLCVVNCPNIDFPICIGIVTLERIPFRKMVAIGNALERTFS